MEPDPSFLAGGVPKTPFVLQQAAQPLFATRAARLRFLAQSSELAPYLNFLADLCTLQAGLVDQLPALTPVAAARLEEALAAGLPPINRDALLDDSALAATLAAVCEQAQAVDMPDSARQALDAVRNSPPDAQRRVLAEVLADSIPADGAATHLFVALAVQLHLTRLAATLPAERLQAVGTGVCPSCGGRPVSSSVIGLRDIDNVRYACCAGCATQWNEVRIKCLCCGSTEGISYRSAGTEDATVKAETCRECGSWLKTLYQVRNASLEPLADDVGSLGLDLLMRDTPFRRAGFNPFLVGY